MTTRPAPSDQSAPAVDLDQVRAAAKFGTVEAEGYWAWVLTEEARISMARMSAGRN
jgi:hypothetical protein